MFSDKDYSFHLKAGFTSTDIRDVYEGGVPSSITTNSEMSIAWRPWFNRTNGKFHPVDWYSACPNTSIAYLRAYGDDIPTDGKIVARTIVYHDANGKPIEYGPMYAGDYMFHLLLHNLLGEKGIDRVKSDWEVTTPFTMQGFKGQGQNWICPFPYLDVLNGPYFSVSDSGVFTFGNPDDLIDLGSEVCYPTHNVEPSHFGMLSSDMHNGLPSDGQWMMMYRRRS